MIEYFVGIDNSHSGAVAMLDALGKVIFTMSMPVGIEEGDEEADYIKIINMIHKHGGGEHNTRTMLEKPHKFAKGINAVRIMWSCYHRIKVGLECNGMRPDCINPSTWQCKMLDVFGDKKSKEWAAKKVDELWGKKFAKTKKECEGINDALLIAEFLRLQHQKNE